jgi:hypothetical protein
LKDRVSLQTILVAWLMLVTQNKKIVDFLKGKAFDEHSSSGAAPSHPCPKDKNRDVVTSLLFLDAV